MWRQVERPQQTQLHSNTFTHSCNVKATNTLFRMTAARLALSVFVLVLAAVTLTEGIRGTGPKKCCFRFSKNEVSKERVVDYMKTSQRCSNPAIVLKTVAGRELCVRPTAAWVKELISYLDTKVVPGEMSNL